jgi:cytochrome P450
MHNTAESFVLATLTDQFPIQSVVGVNAWAIHRNPEIFGSDADIFRPERWMGPREEVARMEQHNYAVRVSSFSCHAIKGRLRIMDTD